MRMSYKKDWEDAKRHWTAYWEGEIIDRPAMCVHVNRQDAPPLPPEPPDLKTKWTDIDYQVRWTEAKSLSVHYLGDAIPSVPGGPQMAWCAYYGGPITYMPDTIWMDRCIDSWDKTPDWARDWDDWGWRRLKEMIRALAAARAGKFFVGLPPTMHTSPNDMLAQMRGVNEFLMDLTEHPAEVKKALLAMRANFGRMYDELWEIIHAEGYEGYSNWWSIWCPDRLGVWQSDVSCMISPAMYEEFIVPELEDNCCLVDRSCYHLDGPGAIKHVERVCEVPGIHTIQWVPGAGQAPGSLQWMELFRKIQAKGKSVLLGAQPEEVETLIRELDPSRILISTGTATVEAAEELLENARKWTAAYGGKRA